MARYLDPKADVTFKKVFGEHKNLVISLLNALLPLDDGKQVEKIEYLPAELVPETPLGKNTIVDVRCEETGGRKFIVEMQMEWRANFKQRVLLNASKAYVKQLPKGNEYNLLQPVYSLNLVNETFEPDMEEYYHYYRMVHYLHSDKVLEGLHLVFVELPKFKAKNLTEKKMQVLWLRFLTEIGEATKTAPQDLIDDPHVNEALEIVEESALSDEERAAYDGFWDLVSREATKEAEMREKDSRLKAAVAARDAEKARADAAVAERDAEKTRADAAVAERDKAFANLDAAVAERDAAIEKLREEKLRVARALKDMNLSAERIAATTGLADAEIAQL